MHRPSIRRRSRARDAQPRIVLEHARPIIPAMMWINPIRNAETPVNIAARRTFGALLAGPRRDGWQGVEMPRQLHPADPLPERLPTRVPHRLHVPAARQFEAFETHLGDAPISA